MKKSIHVLLLDDDEDEYFLTKSLLSDRSYSSEGNEPVGFHLEWVPTFEAALDLIRLKNYDVCLVDYNLGERDGLELVQKAVAEGTRTPFILMTGQGSYEIDLKAMEIGATDYLVKGEVTAALLERSIRYAIERKRAEEKIMRSAQRAELLGTLSHTFSEAGLNLVEVLNTIVHKVAEKTGDGCVIRLLSDDLNWLDTVAIHHPDDRFNDALKRIEGENRLPASVGDPNTVVGGDNDIFQSALSAPLRVKDRFIGTLALVRSKSKENYSDEDKFFLQDLANRAALAIENARLYAAEIQRSGELDALHRATAALLATIELNPLLAHILDIAESAIPTAERAMLHLATSDNGETHIQDMENHQDIRLKTIRFHHNHPCSAATLHDKFPLLITNLEEEPDLSGTCFSDMGLPDEFLGPGSAMIAPLILGEELLGLLSLKSSHPAAFDQSDKRLLMSFANTTVAALRNAMLHAEVQRLAITDSLTEVYNRRGFFDLGRREIDRAMRFGRPLSAILIDIDDFKVVNDSFGHAVGDQVLRIIGERLRTSVREVDILGRYGGDEFVVLLPETEPNSALAAAERIRIHLAEPIVIQGSQLGEARNPGPLTLTASLGVACLESQCIDLQTLISKADAAAYIAKQRGRNRVIGL